MDYSRFQTIYANVPEKLRNEIIVVIDEKPYSWDAAFLEIRHNTQLGQRIYDKLISMEII